MLASSVASADFIVASMPAWSIVAAGLEASPEPSVGAGADGLQAAKARAEAARTIKRMKMPFVWLVVRSDTAPCPVAIGRLVWPFRSSPALAANVLRTSEPKPH